LNLGPADYNTLVQLDSVEFLECGTYADAVAQQSVNAELTSCYFPGAVIFVRNSGFANFANEMKPTGNGSIVAVYNSFNSDKQLFIRDPSDVSTMTDTNRCTTIAPCPYTGPTTQMSIQAVRDLYTGAPTPAPVGRKIVGIVISDIPGGNWQDQNMVVQEPGGAGITIRFDAAHNFNKGDEVEIDISGENIEEFNGLLQVYVDLSDASALSFGNTITPRVATVADIIANANDWESTLLTVQNASLSGGPTYGDNFDHVDIVDATGLITMFSTFSNFEHILIPTGTGAVTAVLSEYTSGIQMLIRDTSDVDIFGGGGSTGNLNQISIQDTRNLFTGSSTTAPDTTKIVGIVISNIPGGNWQGENMVIQENITNGAGITVRFASFHSFNEGDEVEVNISNQTIEEYNNLLQVNGVPLSNATVLSTGNTITPRAATVADIIANGQAWESTLINVANANLNGGTTYGDFGIMLNDATGGISLFSAFSNFATTAIPAGTGDVTGVVGDHTSGLQINIRNTSDVNIGGGGGPTTAMPIAPIRAMFPGSAPAATHIEGIVISDIANGNIHNQNIVVQNSYGSGIVIRFTSATTIAVGDSVKVDVSNLALSEYNDLLQIQNVPNANATVISSGHSLVPRVATTADIVTNGEAWESTLVRVMASTISGAATYSGTTSVTDASGSIDMYTASGATFSGTAVATGTVNITAIVSEYNGTRQIGIRSTADVTP